MAEFIRTFIAIPVQPTRELKKLITDLHSLPGPIRVLDADELHLTLAFLGDTALNQTHQISEMIRKTTQRHGAIDLILSGIGGFPHQARPRVVWAGLKPVEPVRDLAADLSDQLSELGFPKEERRYTPHLTLARVKGPPPEELLWFMQKFEKTPIGEFLADQVIFYQSELSPQGPRYIPLSVSYLSVTDDDSSFPRAVPDD